VGARHAVGVTGLVLSYSLQEALRAASTSEKQDGDIWEQDYFNRGGVH
jgi:hypothetical protein